MIEQVKETGERPQRSADPEADRGQSHVLDTRIGEESLVIMLDENKQRGHDERQQPEGEEQVPVYVGGSAWSTNALLRNTVYTATVSNTRPTSPRSVPALRYTHRATRYAWEPGPLSCHNRRE